MGGDGGNVTISRWAGPTQKYSHTPSLPAFENGKTLSRTLMILIHEIMVDSMLNNT